MRLICYGFPDCRFHRLEDALGESGEPFLITRWIPAHPADRPAIEIAASNSITAVWVHDARQLSVFSKRLNAFSAAL